MTKAFKVGNRVSWNSEAGRVSGAIIRVHMRDVEHKGYPSREPRRSAI
jgi:Hypervirulence associated proteins TUDOR domain